MRKLATIRRINNIEPIPGADRILKASVDGWHVVISKSDNFKVGDLIVYVEVDSVMPEKPEYEFLKSRKYRVRTIVLRGQVSQGLILPLSVLPEGNYEVGQDVTDIIGVTKYDPELEAEQEILKKNEKKTKNPIIKWLCRFKWFRKFYCKKKVSSSFPDWIKKTDEERIQNMTSLFDNLRDNKTLLSVTEKVDGSSATYFLRKIPGRKKMEFGVCSRNRRIPSNDGSYWWQVAEEYDIENVLRKLIGDSNSIVLQGEITGKGIQKNKYPISNSYRFWAFNLITPENKFSTEAMCPILGKYGIMTVPIVCSVYTLPDTIDDLIEYVKSDISQIYPRKREGCVFRNLEQNVSFKCINPDFLLENEE